MRMRIANTLQPIEKIMTQLEQYGTVDCVQGRPVYQDQSDGNWYETSPAILGVVDFMEIHEARNGAHDAQLCQRRFTQHSHQDRNGKTY